MDQNFSTDLTRVFFANQLELSEEQGRLFSFLTDEMLRVNGQMNLTAVTEPREIAVKHYADCAAIADLPKIGDTVCDIGAGAGFPTLPLAILRPDLRITAVDSTEKRMRYVAETASLLGLEGVNTLTARAEELGKNTEYREAFDFVTARAVAPLNILCELCLPLVSVGGRFCALKSVGGREELEQAKNAGACLGASVTEVREFFLKDPFACMPRDALRRMLIVFEKTKPTPEQYPRRYAKIQSKPL
ncbi:MAG: 16S rRNA (guanine(527)-N(7))-methyltransferase RsmG [Clostridia bacterium]|nr:16S rRNA (guanine(527)-N(7))-methyltransferase RsmG [Clostridia bacterium]